MIKIGIIRETKLKTDSRAALTPADVQFLHSYYCKDIRVYVQPSDVRAFSTKEYEEAGAIISENLEDCDFLFGIKEALPATLIPNKHYFFFGHIREDKPYNIPLLKEMVRKGVTFSDYEFFGTGNDRLTSFSYYAGIVGAYNTIRLYGIKNNCFNLEAPGLNFSVNQLKENIRRISSVLHSRNAKFVITGKGIASRGAETALSFTGLKQLNTDEFLRSSLPSYTILSSKDTVKNKLGNEYSKEHYYNNPSEYVSDFSKYAKSADALIACHSWEPEQPILFGREETIDSERRMNIIGDVVCDINGSICTTIKHSSHSAPFYEVDSITLQELPCIGGENSISVMAVDTLPNALPREASASFGMDLIKSLIVPCLLSNSIDGQDKINNATVVHNGIITDKFSSLKKLL